MFQCYNEKQQKIFLAFYNETIIIIEISSSESELCKPIFRGKLAALESIIVDHTDSKMFTLVFQNSNGDTFERQLFSESVSDIMKEIKQSVSTLTK